MENYEVNILKRNGDWKKINPNDLLLETAKKNIKILYIYISIKEYTISSIHIKKISIISIIYSHLLTHILEYSNGKL